ENVTDSDIADHLDMPIDAFYQLYYEANVLQVVSLDDVVGDSDHEDLDPLMVLESVKSKEPDPHLMAIVDSQKSLMMRCIRWLSLRLGTPRSAGAVRAAVEVLSETAELLVAEVQQRLHPYAGQLVQMADQRLLEAACGGVVIPVGRPQRLRHDLVDDAQFQRV